MRHDICYIRTTPCPDVLVHGRKEPIQVMSSRLTLDTCCSQYHVGEFAGPEYDIHIYTCWEEIVVTSFSVTTMDTFQKGMWAQRKFCLWHDPAFLGSTRSPVLNEKQSIISKGQGGVEGEEKIPKGVRWGWETGKDFKGGGAGGEQKSKRKRKT